MKTKIKNIKYWVEYNDDRGILAEIKGEKRFIPESEIETTDIDEGSSQGLLSDCDEEAFEEVDDRHYNGDYSKEFPRQVFYARKRDFRNDYGFKALCYLWLTLTDTAAENAYLELCVTTDWKSDYESERTKMLRKIDECRKNHKPCGFLRSEWEETVGKYVTAEVVAEYLADEKGYDFYDLVEEVETPNEDDYEDE